MDHVANKKPLCIDLFCGLGGWAEGFLAEGYDVIGFDIERHAYGPAKYPGQLVLQDVLTLDGRQFKDAAVIVSSPPCQEYSYMAMPWSIAKAKARWYWEDVTRQLELNCLFNACFRIAHEAGVPLVVENVKGAQPWVGRARANYGSYFLWGAVDSIGGRIVRSGPLAFGMDSVKAVRRVKGRSNFHFYENTGLPSPSFHGADHEPSIQRAEAITEGIKQRGSGAEWFDKALDQRRREAGNKVAGDWFGNYQEMKEAGTISPTRTTGKGSTSRKAASAQIAKIPFPLAQHIARVFKPG